MNKKFIPFGKMMIIYAVFFVFITGCYVATIIINPQTLTLIAGGLLEALSLYYLVSPLFIYTVSFNENNIKIKKDFGLFKEDRIQSKVDLDLKTIGSYHLIMTDRDSEGNAYSTKTPKKKYLEFIIDENTKKRIYVSLQSDNQISKMVDLIKNITGKEISNK